MRRTKFNGGFWLCFLFNILLNLEWSVPAWVLLALHFVLDWSILWFCLALGAWLLGILLWMLILGWARNCSTPTPYRPNKNPYSVGNKDNDKTC